MSDVYEPLTPQRCGLLVIDPQERLLAAVHKPERLVRNTVLLLHCARVLQIPVLATSQYKKGLGPFVPELAELLAGTPSVDKTEFNCMANPGVRDMLAGLPREADTLLLAGAEAHICIYQSAVGLLQNGIRPWIVADAVSSRKKRNTRLALARLRNLGCDVGPAEMAIYELLQKAGNAAFKEMLPYLK